MRTELSVPETVYGPLMEHLLPRNSEGEAAAFVFARFERTTETLKLEYADWFAVPSEDFIVQSLEYELSDKARASVIKRAHDLGAALVEFHSHPFPFEACFSPSDLRGLREFVPHVMWRLKGRPYVAVVVAPARIRQRHPADARGAGR